MSWRELLECEVPSTSDTSDKSGTSVTSVTAFWNLPKSNPPQAGEGESNTPDECIAVPGPPDNDWDGPELELISRIQDDSARDEAIALKNVLGGTLSLAGRPGKFVSAAQYQKNLLDGIFAEHRQLQAKQYAGLTLAEKENLARQAEAAEKAGLRASRAEQRRMQRGWAKWQCWREADPVAADRYRAAHADESGDKNWMLGFTAATVRHRERRK
jgi:hypothetical protein